MQFAIYLCAVQEVAAAAFYEDFISDSYLKKHSDCDGEESGFGHVFSTFQERLVALKENELLIKVIMVEQFLVIALRLDATQVDKARTVIRESLTTLSGDQIELIQPQLYQSASDLLG